MEGKAKFNASRSLILRHEVQSGARFADARIQNSSESREGTGPLKKGSKRGSDRRQLFKFHISWPTPSTLSGSATVKIILATVSVAVV